MLVYIRQVKRKDKRFKRRRQVKNGNAGGEAQSIEGRKFSQKKEVGTSNSQEHISFKRTETDRSIERSQVRQERRQARRYTEDRPDNR